MSEDDKWTLPPSDQIAKMSRKDLVDLLHAHIEHVERGDAVNRQGNLPVAFMRAMSSP
jgi:hypothetical protein